MSTKCTLVYGEGFHFYEDCFELVEFEDDAPIHLELEGQVDFEASAGPSGTRLRVTIPRRIVNALAAHLPKRTLAISRE